MAAILSDECSMHVCVCEKGNAYTHDEHVAFSRSLHALIPNRGNLQVSTTPLKLGELGEPPKSWRGRTALELFGESPTFPRGFKNAPLVWLLKNVWQGERAI